MRFYVKVYIKRRYAMPREWLHWGIQKFLRGKYPQKIRLRILGKLLFFFVFYCHLKKCQYLCTKEKKPLVVRAVYAGA